MNAMPNLAVLDGGASYHHFALSDPRFLGFFTNRIYLPELAPADLEHADAVVVSDRLHPRLLAAKRDTLLAVAERGGTLLVLGENAFESLLPGVQWAFRPTYFWWWRTGDDPGIRTRNPDHPIWQFLRAEDVTWHYHGILTPPAGAVPLVELEEGGQRAGVLLYEDRLSTRGRLLVTTLDPLFHHGGNFMPSATTFLENLLRWLTWDLSHGAIGLR